MAIMYDMLELSGLPGAGDVLGVPGTGADVEFLLTETQATVPDDYFSTGLGQLIEAGFHVGSNGTWPAEIDGTTYSTPSLYEITYDLGGTSYNGFIVEAVPVGGGASRYFFIPQDGVSPHDINQLTITSMNSVIFIDADNAAIDDAVNFVVCFAAGTRLETPAGPKRVETLAVGDMVTTLDRGDLPVLWTAETRVTRTEAEMDERLRMIEIAPDTFAKDKPRRPLRVSRHHRLLLNSRIAGRMFGTEQVLIAAKDLLDLPGVRVCGAEGDIRFFHLLLPCHSILMAENLGAESLWLGEEASRMLGPKAAARARQMLFARQLPARPFISGRRARSLVARHLRNRRCLWEAATPDLVAAE